MKFDINEERKKWKLSNKEFQENFDEIFLQLSLTVSASSNPTFILVGGQAGSGKSGLVSKKYQELNGNAIIIDQDELRTKFPQDSYKQILENYTEREEFLILNPYIADLIQAIITKSKIKGYNIILESALQDIRAFIQNTKDLQANGYKTELDVLAVPEVEANISMLTRYCYYLEKDGFCRRNTRINPRAVENIKNNLRGLNRLDIFDDIKIYTRGNEENQLPNEIYSKSVKQYESPLYAFEIGQSISFENTQITFTSKYNKIKNILEKHNDKTQLNKLETIKEQFDRLVEGVEL